MPEIPAELQRKIETYQQIQAQLQAISMQKGEMDTVKRELERTLEELEKVPDDAPLYKSVGSLLIRADDRASLKSELEERKETLDIRIKGLGKQETELANQFKKLQAELNSELKKGGFA